MTGDVSAELLEPGGLVRPGAAHVCGREDAVRGPGGQQGGPDAPPHGEAREAQRLRGQAQHVQVSLLRSRWLVVVTPSPSFSRWASGARVAQLSRDG